MNSIRNYVSAAAEWCQAMGCPDPRYIEPWVYARFKREAPKHLEVFAGTKAKLSITHDLFMALFRELDLDDIEDLQDAVTYSALFFTAIRRGHVIPKGKKAKDCQHLIRWEHVQFLPSFEDCQQVVFCLESGKVRSIAKKDPTFTATGRCNIAKICPVQLMRLWYLKTFTGDAQQYVFARHCGGFPPLNEPWVRRMRARLTRAATLFGLKPEEFDARNWSGISFRKGALSALAEHLQPHQLAAAADHASVETAFKYYLERTVEQRAANTSLIAAGFNKAASTPMFGARMTNGDIPP
jgi:hypothetical protein